MFVARMHIKGLQEEYNKYLTIKNKKPKNLLRKAFLPHLPYMNIKLAKCDPCSFCDNIREYHRGTSIETEYIDKNRCTQCLDHHIWLCLCLAKLDQLEKEV